jgi:hypothetical protein
VPRVCFVIDSVTKTEYMNLLSGYRESLEKPPALSRVARMKRACRSALESVGIFEKTSIRDAVGAPLSTAHPVLDVRFLEFCIEAARYMSKGYAIGPGDGQEYFYPYTEVSLYSEIRGEIEQYDGWNKLTMRIAPHAHAEEVSDIPIYAHLRTLRALTRDRSVSALLNRLTLWLALFVCSAHYCRKVVVCHPKTGERKVLESAFLQSMARHVSM